MVRGLAKKFYPVAGKKSPYVILEPDEYTAMMSEEYVQYSDPHLGKMKNFSRLAKYIIIVWMVLGTFILLQQIAFPNAALFDRSSSSFFHSVSYVFTGSAVENPDVPKVVQPEYNERVLKGLEECVPGKMYKMDKCNTCHCDEKEGLGCTKMYCPHDGDGSPAVMI